jgi:outer membrane protein assembly factor BamB
VSELKPVGDADSRVERSAEKAPRRMRPRIWPALILLGLYWGMRFGSALVEPSPAMFMTVYFMGPLALTVGILGWWLFASRIPWTDRLLGAFLFLAAGGVAIVVCGNDFPVMAMILYALQAVITVWIGWLVFSFPLGWSAVRRIGTYAAIVLGWGAIMLLRVDGMDGEFVADFNWRWTPTAEQQLLAELRQTSASAAGAERPDASAAPLVVGPGDWAEFRGPNRDSRVEGVRIATDWSANPPKELWRKRVGPGWSSFCVVGDRFFTQEQRGEEEMVVCYDSRTGEEIWTHADAARFNEVVAGPGPRATPTFHDGKLYVQGASGIVSSLDAATGEKIWSRNLVEDVKATVPMWGFSASPLVKEGLVTVFGGAEGKAVVAYDAGTGELRWTGGDGLMSYASTHLASIDGVEQLLMATNVGLYSFDPASGKELWMHEWTSDAARIVQPAVVEGNDVILGTGMGVGTRRIHVARDDDAWKTEEVWTTKQFKPYFNDFVVHEGSLYGFDGAIFSCIDAETGDVLWKERGYGSGQVLLLADQGLLIVLAETGEVALLEANSEELRELAKILALTGKTWNHPVVAHGLLLVRNGEEMVCFELPREGADESTPVSVKTERTESEE